MWTLSDASPVNGKLSQPEFYAALKLIAAVQAGHPVCLGSLAVKAGLPKVGSQAAGAVAPTGTGGSGNSPVPFLTVMANMWRMCVPGGSTSSVASGAISYPVLIKSGVGQAELMKIWKIVDTTGANQLTYQQFGLVLGLIAQLQQKLPLDPSKIGPSTTAPLFAAN